MTTLREFLKTIKGEQYRIYWPNRDCLIFESYFQIHSPFVYKKDQHPKLKEEYWNNNDYCRGVYTDSYKDPAYDEETKEFLDFYGDYEVFSVESSSCTPTRMFKEEDGHLNFEYIREPRLPEQDTVPCIDIFISPRDEEHTRECGRCCHSLLKPDPEDHNGYSHFPDPKDLECKQCWRFLENNRKGEYTK